MSSNGIEKKVRVELDRPYATNDVVYGYEDHNPKKRFVGYVEVSPEVAEDLEARKATWSSYEASRHRDNGRSVQAGALQG